MRELIDALETDFAEKEEARLRAKQKSSKLYRKSTQSPRQKQKINIK